MRGFRHMLAGLAAAACAGCASTDNATSQPPLTGDEMRAIVLAERINYWKDPDSIRDAKIGTTPYTCFPFVCICVAANARNSFGGYTGYKPTVALFSGRKLHTFRDTIGPLDECANLQPFPELNGPQPQNPPVPGRR